MHGELAIRDDSTLLARWARDGSEDAFAEIVQTYERLVLGAALRRTGDAELARDVAQQVFATLAAKAHLLLGRTNLAGWLYQAASHIATRAAQSEMRRRIRHENLDENAACESADAQWPLVEEALAALRATEREALVLHYFQDLAYPEMAAALGIQEVAARKRVSRALQRLEVQIRRRGLRGSITALLAGAVAQQSCITAQAGLASAALAASATTAAPAVLTFTTIMSHASIKIAASVTALALTPLVFQWQANASLRAEVAAAHKPECVAAATTEPASLSQRQTALAAELAAKHAARIAAENRLGELATLKDKLANEVVVSFGTVESMARKLARIVATVDQLETEKTDQPPDAEALKEREKRARELSEAVPEIMGLVREIPKLERDPAKAARFYATLFGEVAGIAPAARATMEQELTEWLASLQQDGLSLAQRPQGKAPEWDARRNAATKRLVAGLQAKLPASPKLDRILDFSANGPGYEFMTAGGKP
jgi:RNA polymerase sigma factor (sigma-70 family)